MKFLDALDQIMEDEDKKATREFEEIEGCGNLETGIMRMTFHLGILYIDQQEDGDWLESNLAKEDIRAEDWQVTSIDI